MSSCMLPYFTVRTYMRMYAFCCVHGLDRYRCGLSGLALMPCWNVSCLVQVECTLAVTVSSTNFTSRCACTECDYVQWNLSIMDGIGTQLAVRYREVSLIQR